MATRPRSAKVPSTCARPAGAERQPGDVGGERAERDPGAATQLAQRQRPDGESEQDPPPDRDPDLVPDDRFVPTAVEAEVDDQQEAQEPDRDGLEVDPRDQGLELGEAGQSIDGFHPLADTDDRREN
ncbi:MAG: hypothetical protein QM729_12320 [Solirubrobacterales bacterium]